MNTRTTYPRLLNEASGILERAGNEDPVFEARELLFYVFGLDLKSYTDLLAGDRNAAPDEALAEKYIKCVEKRAEGYPLQYITGNAPFMGHMFAVNESVLIPRFDTEILVDTVTGYIKEDLLKRSDDCRRADTAGSAADKPGRKAASYDILDIGTGSGCIITSVALELAECEKRYDGGICIRYTGSDISLPALSVAEENAERLGADVDFVRSDVFSDIAGRFDVIISNPPYIRSGDIEGLDKEVRLYEPNTALDGGEDGLSYYDRISREALFHLKSGGILAYEIGYDEAADVTAILERCGYININTVKDLAERDRVIVCRMPDMLKTG